MSARYREFGDTVTGRVVDEHSLRASRPTRVVTGEIVGLIGASTRHAVVRTPRGERLAVRL